MNTNSKLVKEAFGLHQTVASLRLRDYYLMIKRYWFWSLILALLLSSFIVWRDIREKPMYRSKGSFLLDSSVASINGIRNGAGLMGLKSADLVADMRSSVFMQQVDDSFTRKEKGIILGQATEVDRDSSVAWILASGVSIRNRAKTNQFIVEASHEHPEAVPIIINRVMDEFDKYMLDRNRSGSTNSLRFLRSQVEELRRRVEKGELSLHRYRAERDLVSLQENLNFVDEWLTSINSQLSAVELEALEYETLLNSIDSASEKGFPLWKIPAVQAFGIVSSLITKKDELETVKIILQARYGENHPEMMVLNSQLENLDREIISSADLAVDNIRENAKSNNNRVLALKAELDKAEKRSLDLDLISIEYNVMQRKLTTDQALFSKLLEQLNQAQLSGELIDSDIRVLEYAKTPTKPYTPDYTKIVIKGISAFLFVFIGFPILRNKLNSKLRRKEEIESVLGTSYLGSIEKFKLKKSSTGVHELLSGKDSHLHESFRKIYTNLILNGLSEDKKVCVVSGFSRGDGKSTFSASIAVTLAKHGKKTLVIDGDFRAPSLCRGFGVKQGDGLQEAYESCDGKVGDSLGEAQLHEIADGVDLLGAGKLSLTGTEVFQSAYFEALLAYYRNIYDVIIIDTPPSVLFADAQSLLFLADACVYVLKSDHYDVSDVKSALDDLDVNRDKLMGLVLNFVKRKDRNMEYYGKYYSEYGKYNR